MTSLVIVLLVVLWGAVFGPAILRARKDTSPIASVGAFRRGMRALSGGRSTTPGRWVMMPMTPADAEHHANHAVHRRRMVFETLVIAAGASLLLGLIPSMRVLLYVHLVIDAILGAFVLLLLQAKGRRRPKHAVRPSEPDMSEAYLEVGRV